MSSILLNSLKLIKVILTISSLFLFIIFLSSCSKEIEKEVDEEALIPFELLEGKIAFNRGQGRIAIIDAERKTLRHVYTKDKANIWMASLAFSPNGTKLAYAGHHYSYNAWTIFTMDSKGGNYKALTSPGAQSFHGFAPVWSPDGNRIYYIKGASNNGKVYRVNIDGTDYQQVTDFNVNGRVSISSDESLVALCKSHQGNTEGVFIYEQSTKELIKIAEHDSTLIVHSPSFSPDDKKVAYVSMHGPNQRPNQSKPYYSRLHIVNILTGQENIVIELPFEDYIGDTYLSWSPDGKKLAFNYSSGSSEDSDARVYVINSDGTDMTQISHNTLPYQSSDREPSWVN